MMRCFVNTNSWLAYLLACLLFAGCERVTALPDTNRTGYDYFPASTGDYRTYTVNRIKYNFASENDTSIFEYKELLAEAFLNQEGDTTFVVHKFHRNSGDAVWKLDSISHLRLNGRQVVEHSNNKDLIKLVFPVGEGLSWNSNLYNTAQADSFRMIQVDRPFSLGEEEYAKTLTILQRNVQDTIVRQDVRREVYARELGMVYRLQKTFNYCATESCIGQGIINSGLFQEMTLTGYGKE